jgi:hypothetical protein
MPACPSASRTESLRRRRCRCGGLQACHAPAPATYNRPSPVQFRHHWASEKYADCLAAAAAFCSDAHQLPGSSCLCGSFTICGAGTCGLSEEPHGIQWAFIGSDASESTTIRQLRLALQEAHPVVPVPLHRFSHHVRKSSHLAANVRWRDSPFINENHAAVVPSCFGPSFEQ